MVLGTLGGGPGFGWHRDIHDGDSQWQHDERRARALCHGPRWIFFQDNCGSKSALPHPIYRAIWCSAACRSYYFYWAAASGNFFRWPSFSEWLFYMITGSTVFVFRWREPQCGPSISSARIPRRTRGLRPRIRRPPLLHLHRQSGQFGRRMPGNPGGRSSLLLFCAAACSTQVITCISSVPSPSVARLPSDRNCNHLQVIRPTNEIGYQRTGAADTFTLS